MSSTLLRPFLTVLLAAGICLSVIVFTLYIQDVRHQRAISEQEASTAVALGHEFLAQEFRTIRSDLLYLSQQPRLGQFLAGDLESRRALESDYVGFALKKGVYDQVRFLDAEGQEVIRVNYRDGQTEVVSPERLQGKATRYYYREALSIAKGEVFVSDFDLNVEHGQIEQPIKPVIRFLTPVLDESGTMRGLLVLNYMGAQLLAQLQEIGRGFCGETMLLNTAGEYLQALKPEHEWGWLLKHDHNFRADFPRAWERAKQLYASQFSVGGDLFALQRISPARTGSPTPVRPVGDIHDSSCLLLLAYVSESVRIAHSRSLLRQLLLLSAGAMALVVALALRWARSAAIRRDQELELTKSESRLRQLSSRLLTAQESERRSISRALHDELGQLVTAISLDLKSAARSDVSPHTRTLLQRAIEETNQLLNSLHRIASRVRPSVLDDLGLQDAVESFVAEFTRRTGITVEFDDQGSCGEEISPTVCENAYRIIQEALSNVAAHAQTGRVLLIMRQGKQALELVVHDEGTGFDPDEARVSSRLGILGMRERVDLLNGEFELESAPGRGTRIRMSLPLQGDAGRHGNTNPS